jgi:hypothetical protein
MWGKSNRKVSKQQLQVDELHCKACLGEIEQYNYNVSLLALLWSFRNLGIKM